MVDYFSQASFGFPSLAIIYIGIHMKKARILAYWLSKKEKRGVWLAAATHQFPHTSFLSRTAPRYRRRIQVGLLTPFSGPTTFIVLLLVRTKPWFLEHWAVLNKKLPRMILVSLSCHYLKVFVCRKALWLHAEREQLLFDPVVTCNLFVLIMLPFAV